jgi:hypothetical protein
MHSAGSSHVFNAANPAAVTVELVIAHDINNMGELKAATFQKVTEPNTIFALWFMHLRGHHDVATKDQYISIVFILDEIITEL